MARTNFGRVIDYNNIRWPSGYVTEEQCCNTCMYEGCDHYRWEKAWGGCYRFWMLPDSYSDCWQMPPVESTSVYHGIKWNLEAICPGTPESLK